MSLYPQAPQTIGRVLDSGLSLFKHVFKAILPLSIIVGIVAQVPQLLPFLVGGLMQPGAAPGAAVGVAGVVGFIVWFIVYMALYGGWIKSMDALARGQPAFGAGQALSFGFGKVGSIIGASLLFGLAVMIGMVLLVIPGVILMTSLFFYGYLIILEDRTAVAALKESHRLVWGNWWRTATVFFIGGIIYAVGMLVIGGIAGVIIGIGFAGPGPEQVAAGFSLTTLVYFVVQVALNALLLPMWTAMMLVQFRDLQLRKSGADLAARAATA